MSGNKKRLKIFDIAKGLSIILMTLSHYPFLIRGSMIYPSIEAFNDIKMVFSMPMFIFISGYLISDRLRYKEFVYNKLDGLIKPLLGFIISLTILKILLYLITTDIITFEGIMKYINVLAGIFPTGTLGPVNDTLWFVGALFWGHMVFKGSLEIYRLNNSYKHIQLIVLILALFAISSVEFNFYYLEKIPVFFTYLLLGYTFKKLSIRFLKGTSFFYNNKMILFPILFLLVWFVLNKLNLKTYLNLYYLEFNYHYILIFSILGVFSVLYICRFLEKIPLMNSFLIYCSKASFFILAYHFFVIDIYSAFFDMHNSHPILHLFLFFLNIAICCFIYYTVKKIPYVRVLFYPLKTLSLNEGEIRLLKSKYVNRFIPENLEILVITRKQ